MDSATTTPVVPALEVDFDLLIAARGELDRVKSALSREGWKADASAAYNYGRCVEACDVAFGAMSNALITLAVFGKVDGGKAAVDRMNDDPAEAQS